MGDLKPSYSQAASATAPAPPLPPPPPPPPGAARAQPVLSQQQTPTPRAPMKHLAWNKISTMQVVGSDNLWSELGQTFVGYSVDYDQIEALFAVQQQQQQQQLKGALGDDANVSYGSLDVSLDELGTSRKKMEVTDDAR